GELELLTHSLSIVTFRYAPPRLRTGRAEDDATLDAINEDLLQRLKAGGEAFLSNARVEGKFALRACIVNFRTELADVEAVPEIVARLGKVREGANAANGVSRK
ncbi:MAG TPA: aspartate aminotransferase family protein, partial [Thermoanaerobaculia bacterium]|nr:aspartate aminotransferase family protein [Thermoanaerobaculia bacterium]